MEWLRCNKCYDHLQRSDKNFSIIKCGHIFCEVCWIGAASKCPECGIVSFDSLRLTKPPKLETVMNYFSPATHFVEQTKKAMQFHDEQRAISLRGLAILEKKYNRGKKCYEESMEATQKEYDLYQKKLEIAKSLHAAVKTCTTQSTGRRSHVTASANPEKQFAETSKNSEKSYSKNAISTKVDETPTGDRVEPGGRRRRRNFQGPPSSTGTKWRSPLESSANFSNCSTSKNIRQDGFVVPTITKVPKSATLSHQKLPAKPTPRLSEPKV